MVTKKATSDTGLSGSPLSSLANGHPHFGWPFLFCVEPAWSTESPPNVLTP